MPTYEDLLQTDETLKHLNQQYDEHFVTYQKAFAKDWPEKFEVEQEVARRGRLVAERWDVLRQISQSEANDRRRTDRPRCY